MYFKVAFYWVLKDTFENAVYKRNISVSATFFDLSDKLRYLIRRKKYESAGMKLAKKYSAGKVLKGLKAHSGQHKNLISFDSTSVKRRRNSFRSKKRMKLAKKVINR